MTQAWNTRYSLIERLRDADDQGAWDDFLEHYRPFVHYLLEQLQVNISDRDDLVQEILVKLHANIEQYAKQKGRFRSWLGTVIKNTAISYLRSSSSHLKQKGEIAESLKVFESYTQPELEKTIQSEWEHYLFSMVMKHLKSVFSEDVFKCFELTLEGVAVEDIAARLKVKVETVYMIRTRMKARMAAEMKQLMRELEF